LGKIPSASPEYSVIRTDLDWLVTLPWSVTTEDSLDIETARKILRNVFAPGDAWFRTGDLMRLDRQGYFYFVDRIGDTFRWKGENVATTEVAEAVSSCPGVVDVMVYGVAVPGADGKAGMAALVVDDGFDLAVFWKHLAERLPAYARPVFLRICERFEGAWKRGERPRIEDSVVPKLVGPPGG